MMSNKLWEFIDSAYGGIARSQGYDDSVKIVCELLSSHVEAAALVFRGGSAGVAAAAFHADANQLGKHLPGLEASVAAIPQVMLNIPLSGMLEGQAGSGDSAALVVPIAAGGKRLGTLVVLRGFEFSPEELIIGEAAAVMMAANMMAIRNELEASALKDTAAVRAALGTLSYSELEAAAEVFRRLAGDEGSIIAAKVAGEGKVTRSAIVNALRKLESAGLLESHSMGVKGTFIKIRTATLREELRKFGN